MNSKPRYPSTREQANAFADRCYYDQKNRLLEQRKGSNTPSRAPRRSWLKDWPYKLILIAGAVWFASALITYPWGQR